MTPRNLDPDSMTQKLALMRDALDLLRRTEMPSAAALREDGLLPGELADELADSAGMRNVLVHEYVRVDLEQVAAALPRAVEGYERYVEAVADFLLSR